MRIGAALLRIADGLDRTNCAVVSDLRCRIHRRPRGCDSPDQRRRRAGGLVRAARSALFTRVFGRSIEFLREIAMSRHLPPAELQRHCAATPRSSASVRPFVRFIRFWTCAARSCRPAACPTPGGGRSA